MRPAGSAGVAAGADDVTRGIGAGVARFYGDRGKMTVKGTVVCVCAAILVESVAQYHIQAITTPAVAWNIPASDLHSHNISHGDQRLVADGIIVAGVAVVRISIAGGSRCVWVVNRRAGCFYAIIENKF